MLNNSFICPIIDEPSINISDEIKIVFIGLIVLWVFSKLK